MRGLTIGLTGGLLLAGTTALSTPGGAMAQSGARAGSAAPTRVRTIDPRAETLRRLEKRVTLNLTDAPIEDVFVFIQQVADIDIDVRWRDGRTDGIDREARITLNMRDGSLMSILERTLQQSQQDFAENTWQFTPDGTLEVGPKSVLNERAFVKLYDVHDLVFVVPDFPEVPELDLDTVLQQSSQRGGRGGGGGIFQDPEDISIDAILGAETEATMQLMEIITRSIEPDQWVENGGDGASMTMYRQQLLVRAPDYIHRQLGGYDFAGGQRAGAAPTRRAAAGRPLNAPHNTGTAKDAPSAPAAPAPAPASAPASPNNAQ